MAFLPALLWLASAPAQTPKSNANPAGHAKSSPLQTTQKVLTLKKQVNLVLVPVVVRNKKGKPVGSLKQGDFRILDDGKPQTITTFRREVNHVAKRTSPGPLLGKASVESLTHRLHFFGYLFDDVHLNAGNLMRARRAAEKSLAAHLGPQDRAAVFTTSGDVETNFIGDLATLNQAMNKIKPGTNAAASQCPYLNYYLAKQIVRESGTDAQFGQGATPVWDAATLDAENCRFHAGYNAATSSPAAGSAASGASIMRSEARHMALNSARTVKEIGDARTQRALDYVRWAVRRIAAMPGSRTLILVSPGFLTSSDHVQQDTIIDLATEQKVVLNALDARGLYTGMVGVDRGSTTSDPQIADMEAQYLRQGRFQQSGVLYELAYGTGGRFFTGTNNLTGGFTQLTTLPEYVYQLGFRPRNLHHPGRYHQLKVELVDNHGFSVQARRGYTESPGPGSPGSQISSQMEQALFSPNQTRSFPIQLKIGYAAQAGAHRKLLIDTHVDLNAIHLQKVKDVTADSLTVVCGLFDINDNYLQGKETTIQLHLHQNLLQQISKGIYVDTTFDVPPGVYRIRVVVRDAATGLVSTADGSGVIP